MLNQGRKIYEDFLRKISKKRRDWRNLHPRVISYKEYEEPAEGFLGDGVEGSLVGETVEVLLVLLPPLARILLVEVHQRFARLPRTLAPGEKYVPTHFKTAKEKPVHGQGQIFQLLSRSPGASLLPQLLLSLLHLTPHSSLWFTISYLQDCCSCVCSRMKILVWAATSLVVWPHWPLTLALTGSDSRLPPARYRQSHNLVN